MRCSPETPARLLAICGALLGCASGMAYIPPAAGEPSATIVFDTTIWGDPVDNITRQTFASVNLDIFSHRDACKEGSELGLRDTYLGSVPLTLAQPPVEIPAAQEVVLELNHRLDLRGRFWFCQSRVSFEPSPGVRYTVDAEFLFRRRCTLSVRDPSGEEIALRRVTECFPDAEDPSGRYEVGLE
jgi:hypothetical protein